MRAYFGRLPLSISWLILAYRERISLHGTFFGQSCTKEASCT